MLEQHDIHIIEELAKTFFDNMNIAVSSISISLSAQDAPNNKEHQEFPKENQGVVNLDIVTEEPQILIGQGGQTLFEVQRILRMMLNKKLQSIFYLNLDINEYKKKKIEYLKDLAKECAGQVALTKEEKVLLPMSSYERRIIHSELSQRTDIITESRGNGFERCVVIKSKE